MMLKMMAVINKQAIKGLKNSILVNANNTMKTLLSETGPSWNSAANEAIHSIVSKLVTLTRYES
ncbi:hypothetical protein NBRC116592_24680 [Colwellia sp. KU-HH00111]